MAQKRNYYQILSAALTDFETNGFQSQEQLDHWLDELEDAARDSWVDEDTLKRDLVKHLYTVFERTFKGRQFLKAHVGLQSFKLQHIKPKLHTELQNRILASTNLIKLNRDASIARARSRLAGWMSSVPPGGRAGEDFREATKTIRRSIAGEPFIERRVIIDQGHKLASSINDIIARDGGAIIGTWRHSHRGPPAYHPRPEHVARDTHIFVIRDNWALNDGLMRLDGHQYTDEIEQPGELVSCGCVTGETRIPFANVRRVYRRWYDGDLLDISTNSTSGKPLRLTPNHPILTSQGWRRADSLNVGNYLVESNDQIIESPDGDHDEHDAVPVISEIFEFLAPRGRHRVMRGAKNQFHGDGLDGNVDVISTDWTLRINRNSRFLQGASEFGFSSANFATSALSAFRQHGMRLWSAARREAQFMTAASLRFFGFIVMPYAGRFAGSSKWNFRTLQSSDYSCPRCLMFVGQFAATDAVLVIGDDFRHRQVQANSSVESRLRFISDVNSSLTKPSADCDTRHLKMLCQLNGIDARSVRPTQIVQIKRKPFSGHVYNLETDDGWYVADDIVTHNCSYSYGYNLRDLPPSMLTAKGRAELQSVRATMAL